MATTISSATINTFPRKTHQTSHGFHSLHTLQQPFISTPPHRFFPLSSAKLTFKPHFISAPSTGLVFNAPENKDNVSTFLSFVAETKLINITSWALLCASFLSAVFLAFSGTAHAAAAAADSIGASKFGLKVAETLRVSGWPDEAVVFAFATLPVLELRGAIPVGYWMQLKPLRLTVLSVIGNMVPVPFIVLYLKRFASFLARKNVSISRFLDLLFENARQKAGPIEEFQWLGLMLFVAVPFPGTGAWTGAIIASIIDMPFWSAVSANFVGVVFAGLLVNLLVNLGLKYAIVTGLILFVISTVMWSILRNARKSLGSN